MNAIEKRARELLAVVLHEMYPDDAGKRYVIDKLLVDELDLVSARGAIRAIIAALTPPEGHVVVTRNEAGQAVAVTRQDDEGRILSVIAEFGPPEGYVLVPVEPTDAMLNSPSINCGPRTAANVWTGMLAARPEVKP
ncbi:hypothetical protein J5H43_01815 [Stenotrophomonas maltophilia]|uniref:hypothetical protein n=1 Tax=Stenotrophomonas maltophilia TaxID=40324 RepID=UPI001AAF2E6B|nr:hypothetical protein [Stenotrophomonas maltophilia]MBO3002250.1 hypothetical protein [Stenotrophomonas maltophilia]MBP1381606.1 hypothetical protein [Stenotrophomonas maltophilia]MBP1386618.1 hypothetical protein [Stenotrophomonas maltophilia]